MTRFGYVMTTYFALLGFVWAAIFPVSPRFIWNASAIVGRADPLWTREED